MHARFFLLIFVPLILILPGCNYRKGDMYTTALQGDSLKYLVLDKGTGSAISQRAANLKMQHEIKGNTCRIKYISDSSTLGDQQAVLFFNSVLPDVDNDMLTKGFFGAFASKQHVVYLIASYEDVERYFRIVEN